MKCSGTLTRYKGNKTSRPMPDKKTTQRAKNHNQRKVTEPERVKATLRRPAISSIKNS
jgi:hypothetical protein